MKVNVVNSKNKYIVNSVFVWLGMKLRSVIISDKYKGLFFEVVFLFLF